MISNTWQQDRGDAVQSRLVGCGVLGLLGAAVVLMLVAGLIVSLSPQNAQLAGILSWCEQAEDAGVEQVGNDGEQSEGGAADSGWEPPPGAPADAAIPDGMLELYRGAGKKHGVDWAFLAAVGYTESRHYTDPATRRENGAGAAGAMQFTPSTWDDYGQSPDGKESDDLDDRYKAEYSVYSAAYMLAEHNADGNPRGALWRYNQSTAYADDVMDMWEVYRGGELPADDGEGTDSEIDVLPAADLDGCPKLEEASGGGGEVVAAAPDELTQQVVEWALDQRGLPYIWGGTGPDGYDCSGLTMAAYQQVGVNIPRVTHEQVDYGPKVSESNAKPGDLIFFNTRISGANNGPNPRHMGMVVDPERKLLVEAWCTDCGPIATRSWEGRDINAITRPLAADE